MARPTGRKLSPAKLRSTDDGLHLAGSILWFDSKINGDLSFLSSAVDQKKTKVPQVIATEETIKILEIYKRKPNALICQYNRPFSIGTLKMELLPSGCVLGGASLYLETEKGRLLYAPTLQTNKIPTVRQMQLKKANTLILGAYHPDPSSNSPNRKKEKDRMVAAVRAHIENGVFPTIYCQPFALAQEITKLLTDAQLPVAVHNSIFRINKVYEAYGSKLGDYSIYSPKYTKNKVVVLPIPEKTKKLSLTPASMIVFDRPQGEDQSAVAESAELFYISSQCDVKELREVISTVDPKELYIFGPYAKRYVEEFQGVCPIVRPLYPNDQPTIL